MQTSDPSNFFRAEADLAKEDARKSKAARTKTEGAPITSPGKPLAIVVHGNELWSGDSDAVVRQIDLESGNVKQTYRGHTGPVTTLAFICAKDDGRPHCVASGSWDKSIKVWNTSDGSLLSTTPNAHSDFLKRIIYVQELDLLVSTASDKIVRFWDATNIRAETGPLKSVGSVSAHARPVTCISIAVAHPESNGQSKTRMLTADSMGIIKVFELVVERDTELHVRARETDQVPGHRTGVNDMWYANGELWTASSDDTLQFRRYPPPTSGFRGSTSNSASGPQATSAPPPYTTIKHPGAVKAALPLSLTPLAEPFVLTGAGEALRVYKFDPQDDSDKPELVRTVDAHWHDISALALWYKTFEGADGRRRVEPWIVSASLDGTLRRWRLLDLISRPQEVGIEDNDNKVVSQPKGKASGMTEEEERELEELMDSD